MVEFWIFVLLVRCFTSKGGESVRQKKPAKVSRENSAKTKTGVVLARGKKLL